MTDEIARAMPELKRWVGKSRPVHDEISPTSVQRIAAMLDRDPASFTSGTPLPRHWFAMFFADIARQSQIGPDGHPDKGVFLPPIPLPRRMGAGRRVTLAGNLVAGQPAIKHVEVAAIEPKQGRTGNIVVLTMRHTIESGGNVIAVDEFDAVYREAVPPGQKSPKPKPRPLPGTALWSTPVTLDPTMVFRYSAVTWNAHRIHYDTDYARTEEGYPDIVQNGGLTIQLLLDEAVAQTGRELASIDVRLTRPIYGSDTIRLEGAEMDGDTMTCWVADAEDAQCALATLEFAK